MGSLRRLVSHGKRTVEAWLYETSERKVRVFGDAEYEPGEKASCSASSMRS
jgi:hypothetical protein